MTVTREEVMWILIRFLTGEENKTQEEVIKMLLQEALVARGLMVPIVKEKE